MLSYTWFAIEGAGTSSNGTNPKSQLPGNLLVFGDGVSTDITINLQASPADIVFTNNFPVGINSFSATYPDPSFVASLSTSKGKLTIHFNQAMSSSQTTRFDGIVLTYNGE